MATIPQNLPEDIQDDSDPWPEAPEATHTPRQAWCAKVQAIAERAKQTLPECSGRVDAAVKLVLAGDVELLPDGQARVQSQANGQMLYRLVNGTCECRDYEHAPSHWCKHRISVGLMKRAGLPPAVEVPDASPHAEPRVTEPVQGIDPQFVVWIQGRPFVRHVGLLKRAHECGLVSLTVAWTHNDAELSLAHAVAVFADGRRFEENGDASPQSVGKKVALHWRRCACTRASARALRLALGVDLVALEELEDE
jgi:hypothetical protein